MNMLLAGYISMDKKVKLLYYVAFGFEINGWYNKKYREAYWNIRLSEEEEKIYQPLEIKLVGF
jgi:hypothetical protein